MVHTLGAARGETSRSTKPNGGGGFGTGATNVPFPVLPTAVTVATKEVEELHRVRGKVDNSLRTRPTNGTAVKGTLPVLAPSQLCRA